MLHDSTNWLSTQPYFNLSPSFHPKPKHMLIFPDLDTYVSVPRLATIQEIAISRKRLRRDDYDEDDDDDENSAAKCQKTPAPPTPTPVPEDPMALEIL
jgi:hypothetical protein